MNTLLSDLLAQLKGIWARLDGGQRLVVSSVLLATVVGLGAMVWFAGRPTYVVGYSTSNHEDLSSAKQALGQASISFHPDDTGWSLMVERGEIGVARNALSSAGLTSRSSGTDIGVSSIIDDRETKQAKLSSAAIARAEQAVGEIQGVRKARITSSPPRRTRAFVDRDKQNRPTAAVLLHLDRGASFKHVAQNAVWLTASQLGLPPESITVSNAVGHQTFRHDPNLEGAAGSSDFLDTQRQMSEERTARAQEFLDTMWPGKTSVVVMVELDPEWEVVSEKVLPVDAIKRSEESTEESVESQPKAAGSGGAFRSGTGLDPVGAKDQKDRTKNKKTKTDYVTEIGERRRLNLAQPIKRLTVAVAYDRSLAEGDFNPAELEKNIKSLVGWDSERDTDDAFSVMLSDFPDLELEEFTSSEASMVDLALQWGPTVGQILGVAVVLLFLRGLFKRSRGAPADASVGLGLGLGGGESDPEKPLSPEESQRRMRREIERAIASDPAALAKLLESWLMEQGV